MNNTVFVDKGLVNWFSVDAEDKRLSLSVVVVDMTMSTITFIQQSLP